MTDPAKILAQIAIKFPDKQFTLTCRYTGPGKQREWLFEMGHYTEFGRNLHYLMRIVGAHFCHLDEDFYL